MGRKAFLDDLEVASALGNFPNITNVERGDDDGTVSFRVSSHSISPFRVNAIVTDVSDYPSNHEYYIYTESEEVLPSIAAALERIPRSLFAVKVPEMLKSVSATIDKAIRATDGAMEIDSDCEESEDEDLDFGDDDDDWTREPSNQNFVSVSQLAVRGSPPFSRAFPARDELPSRMRYDIRKAKDAGLKVGVLGEPLCGGFICASCRVVKLGLSEEAMKAWGLRRYHYLVLMIQYASGYKTLEQISESSRVNMRVALSRNYKPTLDEAYAAFSPAGTVSAAKFASRTAPNLEGLFIGGPLNDLLNSRLAKIMKYRLACGFGWSAAELFYDDSIGMASSEFDPSHSRYAVEDDKSHVTLPNIVTADHMKQESHPDNMSFPLVAMQFVFRHFVRCTEFCLVCHCKIETQFEALKPYVCSKPLCLYQYMSLGFGPRVEWEILTQPYTVDLLVSFCYASAISNKLKDFPVGIGIQVPSKQSKALKAKFNRQAMELLFPNRKAVNPLKKGDWVVMSHGAANEDTVHARVEEIIYWPKVSLGPAVPVTRRDIVDVPRHGYQGKLDSSPTTPAPTPPPTENEANISIYDQNFDELNQVEKNSAIVALLDTLPDVNSLRAFLQRKDHGHDPSLVKWRQRISKSALDVLRWIIASNRSCIIQVDRMPQAAMVSPAATSPPLMSVHSTQQNPIDIDIGETTSDDFADEERVFGMPGWLQFRFAQGAPDKEQRFVDSVRDAKTRLKKEHPTMFAWHGSPLYNWHSIVREGLHFNETAHGRAFGHGVYMSNNFHTSSTYSGMGFYGGHNGRGSGCWPQSVLKAASALSLNEVVNAPDEFVSRNPHYVISQIDWIQTRYLFVKGGGNEGQSVSDTAPLEVFPQDPHSLVTGCDGQKIQIPLTAVSKSRRPAMSPRPERKGSKKAKVLRQTNQQELEQVENDAASMLTDTEDLLLLQGEVEEDLSKGKNKALPRLPWTDFVPGELDHTTLPILKPPSNASIQATRTLQRLLKSTLAIQESSPLNELGWYIDPTNTENMYQWIVELHTFEPEIPLSQDMKKANIKSIVLEVRFTTNYPISPPFVRVIRPRFLPFASGGGGHVTAGGAICLELLTNSGWSPVSSIESVLLQVRMAMSSLDPRPARLESTIKGARTDYRAGEAVDAYKRACAMHGWEIPKDFDDFSKIEGEEFKSI